MGGFGYFREAERVPRVESARDIHDVLESGALEEAGRDRAAVSALAVNGDRLGGVEAREVGCEPVQRTILRVLHVPALPFRRTPHVHDLDFVSEIAKLLDGDLQCLRNRKSGGDPRR